MIVRAHGRTHGTSGCLVGADGSNSLELLVDRADGKGFVTLAYDTTPDYTDTTPIPATPTKWTYKPSAASATSASANGVMKSASPSAANQKVGRS